MAFVQKSIITMALGLDSMQRAICPPGKLGLCPEMLPVNGSILLQHLMNVSFSFLDEEVHFDDQGDPPGKYEILNFQRSRRVYPSSPLLPNAAKADDGEIPRPESTSPTIPLTGDDTRDHDNADDDADGDHTTAAAGSAGDSAMSELERKRLMNPLYDSYSTLKVYRRKSSSDSSDSRVKRRRRRRRRRHQLQHLPASGYSSTSGYEYVHVGSWKSSDGLSIFGNIHWPRRSSADTIDLAELGVSSAAGHYPQLAAGFVPAPANSIPKSVCSLPCAKGHAKVSLFPPDFPLIYSRLLPVLLDITLTVHVFPQPIENTQKIQSDSVKCCWVCVACRPHEYLYDEFKCKACDKGWWPNAQQTSEFRYLS